MIYTVHLNLAFTDTKVKDEFLKVVSPYLKSAININEGTDTQELSYIEVRESYHDEISRITPDVILTKLVAG